MAPAPSYRSTCAIAACRGNGCRNGELKQAGLVRIQKPGRGRGDTEEGAVALAFGLGALGIATPADAAKKGIDNKRYVACWKKVMPQRSYGPGAIVSVDRCYRGMSW